jgi:hypothetical protein
MQEILDKVPVEPSSITSRHAMTKILTRDIALGMRKDIRSMIDFMSLQISTYLKSLFPLGMREAIAKLTMVENLLRTGHQTVCNKQCMMNAIPQF